MEKKYPACIACSSKKRKIVSRVGRNFNKLITVICLGCGLVHSDPIPSKKALDEFYKNAYRKKYKLVYKPQIRHTVRYARGCFDIIKEVLRYCEFSSLKNKSFLDIGSGSGEVLYFATKVGFNTLGIEPNKGYAEFSKNDLSLSVINTTLEKANLKRNSYDVINLNQVLEHLPEPLNTLKYLKKLLKKNGILVLTVPDIQANLHAPNTRFHYAHIYNYNHLNLKKIFDKVGFQILNPETKSTRIFAKNVEKPDNSKINFDFKKNFKEVYFVLRNSTYTDHFLKVTPYIRFLKKCYVYPMEFFIGIFYNSHRRVLDRAYLKYKNYN